jgi:hypothetical protein
MNPVVLPKGHRLGFNRRGERLAGDVMLGSARHTQHTFEFVREDFDESAAAFRPAVQDASGRGGCRSAHRWRRTRSLTSCASSGLDNRFQINRRQIAALFGKLRTLVEAHRQCRRSCRQQNFVRTIPELPPNRSSCIRNRGRRLPQLLQLRPSYAPQNARRPRHSRKLLHWWRHRAPHCRPMIFSSDAKPAIAPAETRRPSAREALAHVIVGFAF